MSDIVGIRIKMSEKMLQAIQPQQKKKNRKGTVKE